MKTKQWKKWSSLALIGALSFTFFSGCANKEQATTNDEIPTVGIIQYVEHKSLDATREGFLEGMQEAGYEEGKNIQYISQNAQGDQSNLQTIAQQLVAKHVKAVFAIATPSAQTMASASTDIPIVGSAITDYVSAKLVDSNEKPGRNVTGTSDITPIKEQVDLLLKIVPNAKTIGTIYSSSEVNSELQVEALEKEVVARGLTLKKITVSNVNDIQQAASSLVVDGVDAIYVPTDNTVASAMSNLTGITDPKNIPVMCGANAMVEDGGTFALGIDYHKLGKDSADFVVKILKGEANPSEMPIGISKQFEIVVNKNAIEAMGITLPDDMRASAKMV